MRYLLTMLLLAGGAAAQAAPTPAAAQKAPAAAPGVAMSPMHPAFMPGSPATAAYMEAMSKMQSGMSVPFTGDADQEFVAGMIPHHQGAIDMAEVELKYGKDPKMRQLAARIISAQEHEIAMMKAWQSKHPAPPGPQDKPGGPQVR